MLICCLISAPVHKIPLSSPLGRGSVRKSPTRPHRAPRKSDHQPCLCLSILAQRPGSAATFRSPTVAHKPERRNAMRRMRGLGVRTWGLSRKREKTRLEQSRLRRLAGRSCSPLVPMPRTGHEMGAAWCKSWWLSPNRLHWRAPAAHRRAGLLSQGVRGSQRRHT